MQVVPLVPVEVRIHDGRESRESREPLGSHQKICILALMEMAESLSCVVYYLVVAPSQKDRCNSAQQIQSSRKAWMVGAPHRWWYEADGSLVQVAPLVVEVRVHDGRESREPREPLGSH